MRDLDLLATFLQVYRSGSISGAAVELGLSQPSVSERLARLEERRGEVLFERSARGTTATIAAQALAAQVADPIDQLRAAGQGRRAPVPAAATGHSRVGGAADVVASRLAPALAPLTGRGLSVAFSVGLAGDLLSALSHAHLDLVVSSTRPKTPELRSQALIDEEFILVTSPTLAATVDAEHRDRDPVTALAHLPLVAFDEQLSIIRRYWRSQFGRRPPNLMSMVIPDLRGILAAVVAGAGVSALPRYLADPAVAAGTVEVVHAPVESTINTLYLVIPTRPTPSPATAAVMSRLQQQARVWDVL